MRRLVWLVVAALVLCLVIVAAQTPERAHADSILESVVNRVITNVVKRVMGHPEWEDKDVKELLGRAVDNAFRQADIAASAEAQEAAISRHCWRAYSISMHPEYTWWWADFGVPSEWLEGNAHQQLELCVRTGYVPRVYIEGGYDIE